MSKFKEEKLTMEEFKDKYKYGHINQKCCGSCKYFSPRYEDGNCCHPEIDEDEGFTYTQLDMVCKAWKCCK